MYPIDQLIKVHEKIRALYQRVFYRELNRRPCAHIRRAITRLEIMADRLEAEI